MHKTRNMRLKQWRRYQNYLYGLERRGAKCATPVRKLSPFSKVNQFLIPFNWRYYIRFGNRMWGAR